MKRFAFLSFHGCPVARLGERDTGGMNVYVLQIAKECGRRGYGVDVYTRSHDPRDPQVVELGPNARVVHIRAGPYSEAKESLHAYIPQFLSDLVKFQRAEGITYDLVHSHYWLSARAGMVLSRQWGVPHVATFHTLAKTKLQARAGEREPELRVSTEQRALDSVEAVVVSTEQERRDLARLYYTPVSKVSVVGAGVDLDLFRPMDKAEARRGLGLPEGPVVMYVGRVQPLKGLDILVNAMALLERGVHARLVIVGGDLKRNRTLDRLRSPAESLGLSNSVTFTGTVVQTELPWYYGAADVFVLPSFYESFGLAALEAMACGTPVIASRVGGLTTLIKDGSNGYLVPWRCPEPFAHRLDMLLANPSLRETMGRAARFQALQMGWGGVADRILDIYAGLTGETCCSVAGA